MKILQDPAFQVLDSAVAEIHQDLDRRAQDILQLAQRAREAAKERVLGKLFLGLFPEIQWFPSIGWDFWE